MYTIFYVLGWVLLIMVKRQKLSLTFRILRLRYRIKEGHGNPCLSTLGSQEPRLVYVSWRLDVELGMELGRAGLWL